MSPIHKMLISACSLFLLLGCVEEGTVPDCPTGIAGYANWRAAAEEAGCVTPLGGGGAGGTSNQP